MRIKAGVSARKKLLLLVLVLLIGMLLLLWFFHEKRKDVFLESGNRSTLVIDPGHGGIDSGAVGADGTRESDLNLAIALRIRALAELYGVENILVRQDDTTKCDTDTYSEHRDLECRTAIVNNAMNPVYISIHQNNYPTGQPSGPQVIYASGQESQILGQRTHQNLLQCLYPNSRRLAEPSTKKLYILSHVDCPAILVECGFMSNTIDLENLKRAGFQTSIAAILIASYLQFTDNTDSI